MTERPILFSGPMVRAILEGRKSQTRRVVKPQPASHQGRIEWSYHNPGWWIVQGDVSNTWSRVRCHYGVPGDRLWVRETFNPDWTDRVIYKADGGSAVEAGWPREPRWKPSIFMPRRACRLVLEVTGVRVERLQEISSTDAEAEGVQCQPMSAKGFVDYYRDLWDRLNAKRAPWASNPWVWVVEFRRLDER